MLLTLLPLAWSTLGGNPRSSTDVEERMEQTFKHHPEALPALRNLTDDASVSQLLAALPADRLDGALLPERTWMHWVFAGLSAVAFLGIVLLLFPRTAARVPHLAGTALFTGTAGILLLLGVQWLAFHMPLFRGHGWITLLLDLFWLIGQSYRMALGDHGFVLSFLGFTAGVGFCEEACKALPILFLSRTPSLATWRMAMVLGLVSGVGFGVSEGITYSSDYYNGISGAGDYLVRFISCVGLHAIWAGAVGVTVFRRQGSLEGQHHPLEWLLNVLLIVLVPMILHGLYDTLLKQEHDAWALLVAVASFGWLTFQIELATREFGDERLRVQAA